MNIPRRMRRKNACVICFNPKRFVLYSITLVLRLQQVVASLANWQHASFAARRSPIGRFHAPQPLWFHVYSWVLVNGKNLWTLISSPTFICFELVHCNRRTPCAMRKTNSRNHVSTWELGEKTSSFPNSTHPGFEPAISSWSPYHAPRAPSQYSHLTRWEGKHMYSIKICGLGCDYLKIDFQNHQSLEAKMKLFLWSLLLFTNFAMYFKNEGATDPRKNLRFHPFSTEYSIFEIYEWETVFQMEYIYSK